MIKPGVNISGQQFIRKPETLFSRCRVSVPRIAAVFPIFSFTDQSLPAPISAVEFGQNSMTTPDL